MSTEALPWTTDCTPETIDLFPIGTISRSQRLYTLLVRYLRTIAGMPKRETREEVPISWVEEQVTTLLRSMHARIEEVERGAYSERVKLQVYHCTYLASNHVATQKRVTDRTYKILFMHLLAIDRIMGLRPPFIP